MAAIDATARRLGLGEPQRFQRDIWLPPLRLADLPTPPPGKKGWPWTESPPPLPPGPSPGCPWPSLGIVTPSLNQGRYLEETIRSVLLQGYPALEYYIEDGGSSDECARIVQRYERFLSGWTSEIDRGQSHAINKGMARLQRAEWVNWLNSDDILLPGALPAVGRWAANGPRAVALVGAGIARDERGRWKYTRRPRPDLDAQTLRHWRTHWFFQPACFYSKKAFDEVGRLDESLIYAMDLDLWLKLGDIGSFDRVQQPLAHILFHRGTKTDIATGASIGETCRILIERGHVEDAIRFARQVGEELEHVLKLLQPIRDSAVYRRLLRPVLRRLFAPRHLRE